MLIDVGCFRVLEENKNEHPEFDAASPENAEKNGSS